MYGYEWTDKNGIYRLTLDSKIEKEIRPVFKEELDYFGMDQFWSYPETDAPLLWAEGIRRYVLNGECVGEAIGGGFYAKPIVKVSENGLQLSPVSIDDLWSENERIIRGLEKTAIESIRKYYDKYSALGMEFVVAFSGGKDSIVLLDLVRRALSPDKFYVIFSDTGMELSTTYQAVERAKKLWPNLRFMEAKSHLKPEDSWNEFGPPGRRMRWCCSVHKSVPTILLLREITGNNDVKAVVFEGVRAEESTARADRDEISVGAKNINQINCSPILKWNTAELYIYLLHYGLLLNDAYRQGLFRVGCLVCPMSSSWWDGIANDRYPDEMHPFLSKVEAYAKATKAESEQAKFIQQGGWKARMGGRGLLNGGNRVIETIADDRITFIFGSRQQNWVNVSAILGPVVARNDVVYTQIISHREFRFTVSGENDNVVTYWPYSKMDRFIVSHLRGIANKTAYCIGCKACEVQCPADAFTIKDNGEIFIREDKCIHCSNCIEFTKGKGCLAAKSLSTSEGNNGMDLKGMNRYQHFGFRRPWLDHFFKLKEKCFGAGLLGTRQYDALRVWLREAGLLAPSGKGEGAGMPTMLFDKIEHLGPDNLLTWAIIWTNLAYNSIIVKWFMYYVGDGERFEKNELVFRLGDDYSESSRDNAVTALLETFRFSPIGSGLKQGIPIESGNTFKYTRKGWDKPEAVAILYAMYVWAEKTGRYDCTLRQLDMMRGNVNSKGVDPVTIFGIDPDNFKKMLQELSIQYPDYIRTSFVADLDNVKLFDKYSSLDILSLIKGEEE